MPPNKNALIRYFALDRCFRDSENSYNIDDLIGECIDALEKDDFNSKSIGKSSVYEDIAFMRSQEGFNAPIVKEKDGRTTYYSYSDTNYSIKKNILSKKEAEQLKEALITLSRLKGMPQFDWVDEITARLESEFKLKTEENVISFEENQQLMGRELIGELFTAIVDKQTLSIEYKPFKWNHSSKVVLHPYHLKHFNNRWFLFGFNEQEQDITNIALDRIIPPLQVIDNPFKPNTDIDFQKYFTDVVGVSVPKNKTAQKVVLKITSGRWPYIKTKPLHSSQSPPIEENKDYTLIELNVKLNNELQSLIFSYGEDIEVLEPEELRVKMAKRAKKLSNSYNPNAKNCADNN